jgi:signal transduction histidine kinase/CheY-like chemotaxis protein/HPt (histidine-containing phosphotransfer) domain-containing protein
VEHEVSVPVSLSERELAAVFPFHLACSRAGTLLRVGHTLSRIAPELVFGEQLSDHARLVQPSIGFDFELLVHAATTFVVIELNHTGLILRGQLLVKPEAVLFLVSPWLTDPAQLPRFGLNLSDFADHDPLVDYVLVLQSKNAALAESLELSARLTQAQAEMARVHDELSQARERAEAANETKSSFLAMMSHEMRTPLGAIVGLTELLRDEREAARRPELVARLSRNARSLLELIEDVLDFAKIEAGEIRAVSVPFSPRDVMEEAVSTVAERAREQKLDLTIDVDPAVPERVLGDGVRVRQILVNLLGNAIKYTRRGTVTVRVFPCRHGLDTGLRYDVIDTGEGIPKEQRERVFERFVRLPQSDGRLVPGTGLGLSIVRGLVNLMDGQVDLESEPGVGTYFSVFLPQPEARSVMRTSEPLLERTGPVSLSAHLLLVEDDADNRHVITAMLEKAGHHVDAVENGLIALARSERIPYDLVLTDLQMPKMDGTTFVEALRARESEQRATLRTPVVAITAHALPTYREQALAAGMDDFATKPVTAQMLAQIISRWADTRPLVLAVDDVDDNLLVLEHTLGQRPDIRLQTLPNAHAMLEVVAARRVDLVLLDLELPGLDGYEATQRLRADPRTRALPVVALTAHAGQREAERCREVGCDAHLVKPVRPRVLEIVVEKLLARGPGAPVPGSSSPVLRELVPKFIERRLSDMRAVLDHLHTGGDGHLQAAARLAHNAKGTGGAYGFPWLSELAGELESALHAGRVEDARHLVDLMLERLERARTELAPS